MCPALQTDMKPELLTDPYESFMQRHLRYYGYFKENKAKEDNILLRPAQRNRIKEQEATDSDSDRQSSLDDQKNLIYSLLLESAVFKSRQIVFDNQEGQAIPRLSEPRDLFSTSKKNGLLKPPRWPTECEVIPEKISHVEWEPPRPEPFYRHTGKEAMPYVSFEGEGKVVYEIRQAYMGSYFTGSRAGGRRCATNAPLNMDGKNNNDLQFESRFESGNLQKVVNMLLAEREILLYCDFHGHSRKNNVFMYGCNNKGEPESKLHERVFPLMLSKNAPDKFVFKGCKFKVQKSKEGTGRIVMWRHGIRNSYTMESTFCGSTLGDRKNTHFTTGDLESMGHHFCDTLLDYCDPDTTKFKVCLSEIHAFVREEIKEKLKRLGRDVDSDVNLSDISLSDIESSTSGSNSSESDGLPAHLLHIANKFCQKKKRLRSRKERNHMYQKRSSKHKLKSRDNADISEAPNQTAKSTNSKNSGKVDVEKKKLKTKSNESSLSQSDVVQTSTVQAAEKSSEKPILSYARKPDSVSVKTQLINRLPTSFVGDFSSVDHVCPRHATVKSREPAAGNRFPLIITVIQRASLPPYSKDSSPIKQHPPPFHAMLDFSNDRSHVSDHILKREKSFTSRPLVPAVGTKPYSFATTEKQKHLETSTVDLQLSLSPTGRKNSRVRQGSLIALVTSDYLDNLLLKPKKDASQSVQSLPILRKSDSFSMQASEDIAFSKMAVPSKSYVQPLDHTAVQTAAGLNMSKRTESGDHQKLGHSAVEKLQVNIKKEGENSLQGSLKKKGGRRSPTANPTVRQDRNKYSGLGVIALFFRVD
ncbi:cytosolic carboxypeptidase 2 isoform X11 [Hyla sarda]|uniref:cytosolic carboxypeptidase 2 isoform X11 n=1 Tax=Hyla sarda TaxID=327740 RepID=UPI0024C2D369|nr:cytosolic carboxypeptidase 2 isoform X11 [Hyla sarda]